MTRQIRTTLLTGLFFFGLLTGLQAQDKYEYTVITYVPYKNELHIAKNGIDNKVDVAKVNSPFDASPAVKEVEKMIQEGWELYDSNGEMISNMAASAYFFFLKKKIG